MILDNSRIRITTEDISGLNVAGRPQELEITSFGNRPIINLSPSAFPRSVLDDIARAIVDKGWASGVRSCEVSVGVSAVNGRNVTKMKARLTYAKAR